MEEHVAKLLDHLVCVVLVYGLNELVALLKEQVLESGGSLLLVPGTSIWAYQSFYQLTNTTVSLCENILFVHILS